MADQRLSTELLFKEIKNALEKRSEILELDFDLEFENDMPKIFSIEKDENWGIFNFFLKVKDQNLFYIVNVENSEKNEIIAGYYYSEFQISLIIASKMDTDRLLSSIKIKPASKKDYSYPDNIYTKDAIKSIANFKFNLKPNFLQNQILEFLNIMDSDKINFQKLLNENHGFLSIGVLENDLVENFIPLPVISNELIKRLSEYNLHIQFGKIIKK